MPFYVTRVHYEIIVTKPPRAGIGVGVPSLTRFMKRRLRALGEQWNTANGVGSDCSVTGGPWTLGHRPGAMEQL